MADDFAPYAHLLKAFARRFGGRVGICNIHDYNVCTSVLDWRVKEVTPPPDRFVRQVKAQYAGRPVVIRANNEFVQIKLSADLAAGLVFSVNRADSSQLTELSALRVGPNLPVFLCSDPFSASVASVLQAPTLQRAIECLELGPEESLHVYQNGVSAYTRPNSERRLETLLMGLVAFVAQLPPGGPVSLEVEDLPAEFHPLRGLIRTWGTTDDEEREELLSRATKAELSELVTRLKPYFGAIKSYLDRFNGASMPMSAIELGALAECGTEAILLLGPETKDEADARRRT